MKHYFDSMTPYYLAGRGKLEKYPHNSICIKGDKYRVDKEPFQRIKKLECLKDDDDGFVLEEKHVFRIRQQDNNNEEICIKLDWYHTLLLRLRFMNYKDILASVVKLFTNFVKQ